MARPHGRARVSQRYPEAIGICDRCGFMFTHKDLTWTYEWRGPRLQNERILVCRTCNDKPAEFLRTVILPPDPVPIANARPENYVTADNPVMSNFDPLTVANVGTAINGAIGNMSEGGGLMAAFVGAPQKTSLQGALLRPSLAGANNYLGQNWSAQPGVPTSLPSQLTASGVTYVLGSFVAQAPSDQAFLASGGAIAVELDGWDGSAWTALWSDTSSGSVGETLSVTLTTSAQTACYGHRLLLTGDGTNAMAVAHLKFNALGEAVRSSAPAVQPS